MEDTAEKATLKGHDAKIGRSWDGMLEAFRALGGVADNICEKDGPFGRGLFPIDPARPAAIRVPETLLFDSDNLAFKAGQLRIKKPVSGRDREEAFFEAYQDGFSWGAGGREDCEAKLKMLISLPETIRDLLSKEFGLGGLFGANDAETVQNRFVRSRQIHYQGRRVIMPVMELVNHSVDGLPYQLRDGISLEGTFKSEILARYSGTDPFGIFCGWGFSSGELVAFSLPMRLKIGRAQIDIGRDVAAFDVKGQFRVPKLTRQGARTTLSHLMLGNARYPRLSKAIFYDIATELGHSNPEALFDRVRQFNMLRFLNLMSALEPFEGPAITELRRVARFQLEAISHCIGTRAL